MRGIKSIFVKEWKCFTGSDRGLFLFYSVLIISWSLFLAFREKPSEVGGPWWLIFFSVVVTANFSSTVFISERINGALEILITSGFSRKTILIGKMVFILCMSVVMGIACLGLGTVFRNSFNGGNEVLSLMDFFAFIGAAFYNTAGAAFLSVRMSNPRLLHIANMLVLTVLVILYSVLSFYQHMPPYALVVALFVIGAFFTWLAIREFESERVLRPVDL